MARRRRCEECGERKPDVVVCRGTFWTPWGHNAFHCAWEKSEGEMLLCEDCCVDEWRSCNQCGDRVSAAYSGMGYSYADPARDDDDEAPWDNETMCPECAIRAGAYVQIGAPPARVYGATPTGSEP